MSSADGGTLGNVFVYVKDGLGNYVFDTPTEPLKLDQKGCRYTSARVRHPRQPAARDRQQRSDAAQHPCAAQGEHGVQQRPADPGHEDDPHLHCEGSDAALQVRRAWLDERVRGRARSPVLRRDRHRRQVRAQVAAARHLHDRGLAREARHRNREA